jgi:hypothetical protein
MTREEVTELMSSSKTEEEWGANCDAVIAAFGGYPPFWGIDIIHGGVMSQAARSWPTNSSDLFEEWAKATQH